MFNAIFGNFLFSRPLAPTAAAQPIEQQQQTEAATQTTEAASISTQTNNELSASVFPNCKENELTSTQNQQEAAAAVVINKKPVEDWVIVDANEETEKLNARLRTSSISRETGSTQTELIAPISRQQVDKSANTDSNDENLIEMQDSIIVSSPYDVKTEEEMKLFLSTLTTTAAAAKTKNTTELKIKDDDDDVMLGSFFERNEREMKLADEHEQVNPVEQENETWLITPLPCLTSIISSQRSIVENGTLENLLIEHPSMSVFMSATSSCASSPIHEACEAFESKMDHHKQNKVHGKVGKKSYKAALLNQQPKPQPQSHQIQQEQQTPEVIVVASPAKPFVSPIALKESQPKCSVITKSVAEKRKESEKSNNDLANTSGGSNESLSAVISLKRKEKKNKKSSSPVGSSKSISNKENQQQVKTLLLNELKRCGNASSNRFDCTLSNKNQMKRNNKNATLTRDANKKQRKYHNLQQPSFSYNSSNNNQY